MSERQATDLRDISGRQIVVTVSKEFGLVKIEDEGFSLVMTIAEFESMANWALERKK